MNTGFLQKGLPLVGGIVLACVLAIFGGCGRQGSTAAPLPGREWRAWVLPPEGALLPTPRSVAVGPGDQLAALDTAGRVLVYSPDGTLLRRWQMLDVSVGKPEGLVVLQDGRVVVCDTHYHRVAWFDPNGALLSLVGKKGAGNGEFMYPVGICKDAQENLYICEYGGNDRVQKFTRDGQWLASFGSFGTEPGQFQRPSGLAWREGKLYVADAINNRVLVFSDAGAYLGLLGAPDAPLAFELPYDIALGGDGLLYVIEYGGGRLSQVSAEGKLLGRFGKNGNGPNEFSTPWGIALDSTGRIYVADTKNRRLASLRL